MSQSMALKGKQNTDSITVNNDSEYFTWRLSIVSDAGLSGTLEKVDAAADDEHWSPLLVDLQYLGTIL